MILKCIGVISKRDLKEQSWLDYETQKSRVEGKLHGSNNIDDGLKANRERKIIGIVLIVLLVILFSVGFYWFVVNEY